MRQAQFSFNEALKETQNLLVGKLFCDRRPHLYYKMVPTHDSFGHTRGTSSRLISVPFSMKLL